MKYLAYYTLGYQPSYIDVLQLSVQSLRKYNPEVDIRILCDTQFKDQVASSITDVQICERPNSTTPEAASMQKLSIFHEDISGYDVVLFIDSDILIGIPLAPLLAQVTNGDQLYAYAESNDIRKHLEPYWSLQRYTMEQLKFFFHNNIYVFNAGLFAFKPTDTMRTHFTNVETMIQNYTGRFFYEQSFMNVYFNAHNLVNYTLWTTDNYSMFADLTSNPASILHFCGAPGDGRGKLDRMRDFIAHTRFFECDK